MPAQNNTKHYKISDVADLLNISQNVIRNWESEHQIEVPRNHKNHRVYTQKEISKLKELQKKLNSKFTVKQNYRKKQVKNFIKNLNKNTAIASLGLILFILILLNLPVFPLINSGKEFLNNTLNTSFNLKNSQNYSTDVLGERDTQTNFIFEVNIPTNLNNQLTVQGPATFEDTVTAGNVTLTGTGSLAGLTTIDAQTQTTLETTLTLAGDITGPINSTSLADELSYDGTLEISGTLNISGELEADGETGSSGEVLTSTGDGVEWGTIDADEADTLDDLDSLQFLRSDTSDSYTSGTLSFSDGTFLDLSSIVHNDTAAQGLRLPQNTSLTSPASGEGYLAYDTDANEIYVYDGTSWSNVSGAATTLQNAYDGGSTIQMSSGSGDLRIYNNASSEVLFLDEDTARIGIGTTGPSSALHIVGGITVSGTVDGKDIATNAAMLNEAETISANWVNTANPWANNEVVDALTISSSGSVDDGALSSNVSLLAQSIETGEITDSTILEADLSSTNGPTDNYILSYDNGSGGFTWIQNDGGTGATQWTTSGSNIYYDTGNVGIGHTDPQGLLHLQGTSGNQLYLAYDDTNYATFDMSSSGDLSIGQAVAGADTIFTDDVKIRETLEVGNDFTGPTGVSASVTSGGTLNSNTYYIQVAAVEGDDESIASSEVTCTIDTGSPDIAVSPDAWNLASVLLNNGDGTFASSNEYSMEAGELLTSADFDQDGDIDLAAANELGDSYSIAMNDGNGDFSSYTSYSFSNARFVTPGDFNGDNYPDLAIISDNDDAIHIRLNNGDGTFGASDADVLFRGESDYAISSDFNNDDDIDIAVADSGGPEVDVYLGNGDGTFNLTSQNTVGGVRFFFDHFHGSIHAEDFNNDGNVDIVNSNQNGDNSVSVLLGNGDGTFASHVTYSTDAYPYGVDSSDFDGNGYMDIVTANYNGDNISVLLNDGDGTFGSATNYNMDNTTKYVQSDDLDGDGNPDIVAIGFFGDVSVFLNNGDGTFASKVDYSFYQDEPFGLVVENFDPSNDRQCDVSWNAVSDADSYRVYYGTSSGGQDEYFTTSNTSYSITDLSGTSGTPNSESSIFFSATNDSYITDSNLGIGTTSPSTQLHLTGDLTIGGDDLFMDTNTSGHLLVADGTNYNPVAMSGDIGIDSAGATSIQADVIDWSEISDTMTLDATTTIDMDTNTADLNFDSGTLYIDNAGSIGIGTTSPSGALDLVFDQTNTPNVTTTSNLSGTTPQILFNLNENGGTSLAKIAGNQVNGTDTFLLTAIANRQIALAANYNYANPDLLINTSGQIGIGTTNPSSKLQVAGNILPATDDSSDLGSNSLRWQDLYLGPSTLHIGTSTSDEYAISYDTTNNFLGFNVNGSGNDEIVFDSNGYLGIGTTNPSYLLDVAGKSATDSLVLDGSNISTSPTTGEFFYKSSDNKLMVYSGSNWEEIQHSTAPNTFADNVDYSTGVNPRNIASADFDNDNYKDLVVPNGNDGDVSVLISNGSAGTFATKVDYAVGSVPYSTITGDFNNDDYIDIASMNLGDDDMSILINDGDGTFAAKVDYPTGTNPYDGAVDDFDNDGYNDIAVANSFDNTMSVFINDGDGTFATKVDYTTGTDPRDVAAGDYNNDGYIDLATINTDDDTFSVFINDGDGTFAAKVDYPTGGTSPNSLESADFNQDGYNDLVTVDFAGAVASVFLNDGDGTFATNVDYTTGGAPRDSATTDINDDGYPDIISANDGNNSVSVLINDGDGTFATKVDYDVTGDPYGVVGNDFDNDGYDDIATVSWSDDLVSVLLNDGSGNNLPETDDRYSLGSDSLRWKDLYLGPSTLHIGTSTSDEYAINYDTTNNFLGFSVNGGSTNEVIFNSSGEIGVGTTDPQETLDISGGLSITGQGTPFGGGGGRDGLQLGYSSNEGYVRAQKNSLDPGFNDLTPLNLLGSDIIFQADSDDSATEVARINSSGYFGIGITSPSTQLHLFDEGDNSSITEISRFARATSGTALDNVGVFQSFYLEDDAGSLTETGRLNMIARDVSSGNSFAGEFSVEVERETFDDMIEVFSAYAGSSNKWFCGNSSRDNGPDCFGFTIGSGNVSTFQFDGNEVMYWRLDGGEIDLQAEAGEDLAFTTLGGTKTINFDQGNDGSNLFIAGDGNIGIGDTNPSFTLTVDHNGDGANVAYVNDSNAWTNGSADYAEFFYTDDTDLESGEVVCIDTSNNNAVVRCKNAADNNVMGIISTSPAFLGNAPAEERREDNPNYKIVAMLGQIPAKVTSENGKIKIGDSLTPAKTPGHIMKANPGESTVAVALESFDGNTGTIQVMISRRNKSLTVESVEQEVTERIAQMEIEDEVSLMVSENMEKYETLLGMDADIATLQNDFGLLEGTQNNIQDRISRVEELLGLNETEESTESSESFSTLAGLTNLVTEMETIFNEFKEFTEALGLSQTTDEEGNNVLAVNSDLNVTGDTTLSDVNITGDLMAGLLKIDSIENSINISGPDCTLSSNGTLCDTQTLHLQKNLAGNVDILDGTLIIKPDGTVKLDGTLEAEKVLAGEISIKESSQTVGSGIIPADETLVEIENSNVRENSKIFITPTTSTGGQSLIVASKQDEKFTVELDNPISQEIQFDWWIVNVE